MNPMDLLKNMGQLQETVQEAKKRMKETRVTGAAGGDMVQIEMNGEFSVLSIHIAPEVIDPTGVEMLQDLIRAAHNDAVARIRGAHQENLSSLTGGIPIPPGLFGSG